MRLISRYTNVNSNLMSGWKMRASKLLKCKKLFCKTKRRKHNGRDLNDSFTYFLNKRKIKWGNYKICLAENSGSVKIIKMTGNNTSGLKRHLPKVYPKVFKETYSCDRLI